MKTTNIISTPEITGNIGSCTTNTAVVKSDRTLFVQNIETIATNSCNGQVQVFKTWEFTEAIGVVILVVVFMCIGVIAYRVSKVVGSEER